MHTEKDIVIKIVFANELKMGLPQQAWVEKTAHEVEIHQLSCKEKVPGARVSKEGHADSLLRHEMTHHYWFPWNRYHCIH